MDTRELSVAGAAVPNGTCVEARIPDPPAQLGGSGSVRLDKALALAGAGSRRVCAELVAAGRVIVDGFVTTDPRARVDATRSRISLDGNTVEHRREFQYLLLHKPPGVVATMRDPAGRRCLGDFLGEGHKGLFHVGRLDVATAGLQILMNDGELARRMTDRSFAVERTYLAQIKGPVPADLKNRLLGRTGPADRPARIESFHVVVRSPEASLVRVTLHEGPKPAARLLAQAGCAVHQLVCTAFGTVTLGDLKPGSYRPLTPEEIRALHATVGLASA